MFTIVFALLLIIDIIQLICFGGGIFQGIVVALFCVGFLVLKFVFNEKISKLTYTLYTIVAIGLIVFLLFTMSVSKSEKGFLEYNDFLESSIELIEKGKFDDARKLLETMQEKYGDNDAKHILTAIIDLEDGKITDAYSEYNRISKRDDKIAMALYEQILMADANVSDIDLGKFYLTSADKYPDWAHMQLFAGIYEYNSQNYNSAEYWLLNAYSLNEKDFMVTYYLGALYYQRGDYESSMGFFAQTIDNKAPKEYEEYISWYLARMGYWD